MQVDYIVHGAITLSGVVVAFVGHHYLTPKKKKPSSKMAKVKRGIKKRQKREIKSLGTWSKAVLKRDNYECDICKKKSRKNQAHHLYSKEHYPRKQFDLNNGVTLCKEHHIGKFGFHSWNGGNKKKSTPKMYEMYKAKSDYTLVFWIRFAIVVVVGILILRGAKW